MASFASYATTCGARKHAWTKIFSGHSVTAKIRTWQHIMMNTFLQGQNCNKHTMVFLTEQRPIVQVQTIITVSTLKSASLFFGFGALNIRIFLCCICPANLLRVKFIHFHFKFISMPWKTFLGWSTFILVEVFIIHNNLFSILNNLCM